MDETQPLRLQEGRVKPEWVDEFGHMNMARYVEACDLSTYALWEYLNRPRTLEEREGLEANLPELQKRLRGARAFVIESGLSLLDGVPDNPMDPPLIETPPEQKIIIPAP